ncbi:MAG: acyl-ACP--UDP-N-acetylglucosamine O-acyltransferase [Deltaproteobacteria bacterium]|nr:acyl-ACP--UDP-N-acetylglucosamine O-acyltransferase [Deltaproteobacteria bacterium]MDO8955773.1 acyl-ACP--UDP-N-acetylglucosamine O-acyltransferase [Deltaproteobacteria bacterium]MDP3039976.1 acyl-ACP--UDP-N-acetylglucosamine O-acyltransferase [Deltaproteobacteria bacterium]
MDIHPTAIVHPRATIAPGVKIGAYSLIGENVRIGKDTVIDSHVVVEGWTEVGERCHLFPFVSIGTAPQHMRYRGEPTRVTIGNENVIREFVTIHRATVEGGGNTTLGHGNFIMAYSHIAHDCKVGNQVIMANASTLAGHIAVEDFAIVGGLVAIHQFVRVGCYAIIGGASGVPKDIPPYMCAAGNRAKLFGLNTVGLKRHRFSEATLFALKQAYRILFRSHLILNKAIEKVETDVPRLPEITHLLDFLKSSKRGVCR